MLVRHHDLRDADRLAVLVAHGDLALGVRPQDLLVARVTSFRDQAQDLVCVVDRGRHQFGRLVAGVAEHDALVAGALFLVGAGLQGVDALRDVGRLRVQQDFDVGGLPVEASLLVTDVLDGVADDLLDVVVGDRLRPAGLAGDHDLVGGRERLACGADCPGVDAGLRAFPEEQIDDLVGDAIAHLVGMPLRNRFTREQIRPAHQPFLLSRKLPNPTALFCVMLRTSIAPARDDVRLIVEPKPIVPPQDIPRGVEVPAALGDIGQTIVLDLGDIHCRIPCRKRG